MPKLWGSALNRIAELGASVEPEIGVGVTEFDKYDRRAYEVIGIVSPTEIIVRRLKCINKAEWPEQDYEYESDEGACPVKIRKVRNGRWRYCHSRTAIGTNGWIIGYADEYKEVTENA